MRKCFVLMPFSPKYERVYDVYVEAGKHAETLCYRADEIRAPGVITTDIVREITRADMILADLTGNNANVFYELGVAQAAGKPVVITCRRGTDLPFDVKLHRVIFYELHTRGIRELKEEVVEYLSNAGTESHEMDFVFEHVHGRRMLIERRLNMAVISIAEASKLRIRDIGMHLYLAESNGILRRAARDTIRSVASTPQSDRSRQHLRVTGRVNTSE
jgi:nucleoside 2-deoxyribosyltransferase